MHWSINEDYAGKTIWQNLIEVTQAPTFPLTYSLSTWLNLTNSLSSWTGQLQYSQFMKPTLTHKDGSISKSSGQPFVTPVWSPEDPPRDHQFIICQFPPQKCQSYCWANCCIVFTSVKLPNKWKKCLVSLISRQLWCMIILYFCPCDKFHLIKGIFFLHFLTHFMKLVSSFLVKPVIHTNQSIILCWQSRLVGPPPVAKYPCPLSPSWDKKRAVIFRFRNTKYSCPLSLFSTLLFVHSLQAGIRKGQ